jgi:dipeptidyl aminopeptidase/acylaminoacyl peptidase
MVVVALVATLLALPCGLGGLMMWGITHPGCADGEGPASYDLEFEEVAFANQQGLTLRGYFLPGDPNNDGATVILSGPLGNGRGTELPDAAILNRAGLNVLTYESRVCGGAGFHSLGYLEAEDVQAAYDYLITRDDVNPDRVSAQGFSSAGSTSLFATAQMPELRGVVAKGGYHNFAEQLGLGRDGNALEFLIRAGADLTYRLVTGLDVRVLMPVDAVESITPRPILLIYGSAEVSLPGARQMLERANRNGGNAELYIVEGAGHGTYLRFGEEEYEQRLADFHLSILLDDADR